jgi:hypothetical protein
VYKREMVVVKKLSAVPCKRKFMSVKLEEEITGGKRAASTGQQGADWQESSELGGRR